MEEENQVVIDVKMDALIESLRHLNKEYEIQAAILKDMKDKGEETTDAYLKLSQEMKVTRQEISGVEKQMQNEIKVQKANTDSLVQMRAQLANLNKQYDSMSGFERMGVEGLALRDKIAALSHEIQGLEEDTGRWQRNVGNYKSALKGMKDATEAAGLSSRGLDRIMKGLSTNPWMAVITLLVSILVKLRDRLKDNEQVTKSLGNAMSSLQPIFDWFNKIISKIADVFSNVLDWAIQKVIQSLGWLGRQLQKLGAAFGKDWGGGLIAYSETMGKTAEATTDAADATDNLATSMSKMANTAKEAKREVSDLIKELKSRDLADNIQRDLDKAKEALEAIEKLDTKAYEKYKVVSDEGLDDIERASNKLYDFAITYKENAKDIESTSTALQSSFGSLSSIYKQMASDETKSEEERARASRMASRWAKLQIAANSGTALAKGISGAMDAPTVAGKIAALASIMAAVLSAIAQAKALAAESHEHGGVIGNKFVGATRGGDDVLTTARRGEMMLNADQQRRLFDIANGNSQTSLAESLFAAIQAMPAPVMVYSEYNDFKSRVATFNETAKLK